MLHLQATFTLEEWSVERWRHFRSTDMYDESCHWLKTGRLDIVSSLSHHFADILSEKLVSCLDATLALVPEEVEVNELCAWLTHAIVPHAIESQDCDVINSVAEWVERRAADMEVTHKHSWPLNAIQLCDVLASEACGTLFKYLTPKEHTGRTVALAVPQTTLDEARQSHNALLRLRMLRSDLRDVVELRERYSCSLSLAEFRSETVQSLAYHLLDRVVAVELISAAVAAVVVPYATQNGLNVDELLVSYIEELVHRRGSGGMRVSMLWESKAVEILRSISNRAQCEQALMAVLSAAQFPWTEDVSNAVKTALTKNPSHAGLKHQCQLASLKQTLTAYGLQSFNFAEMMHAEDLAYHILMQDRPTAVEDALTVTDFYSNVSRVDVYLLRCCFLAERNRADEIVCLMRGVTPPMLLDKLCERFICYCSIVLSDPLHGCHREYAAAARHIHRLVITSCQCSQGLEDQLTELNAVFRLESEFGRLISVSDYASQASRQQFYDQCLSLWDVYEDDTTSIKSVTENLTEKTKCVVTVRKKGSLRELACLLKMSACHEVDKAVSAARGGNIQSAIELAERIVERRTENTVDVVRCVLRILKAVCGQIENGGAVTVSELHRIHRLSCNLVLTGPASMVDQCLRVARSTRLAVEMSAQCSSDSSFSVLSRAADPFKQWTFDDYLSDHDCSGLVMDPELAMLLAFSFVAACLPSTDHTVQPTAAAALTQVVDVAGKLAQLLTDSDQMRLFLGYFLEVAALMGGLSELEELRVAVLATLKQCVSRRRADHQLALTAVLSLTHSLALDNLHKLARSAGIQYKKVLAIAQVGLAFAQLTHHTDGVLMAQSLVIEAGWGYRLAKVHLSFREYFGVQAEAVYKQLLIPKLAASESICVDDVVQYCKDFKLDTNYSLCLYLTCLLLPSSDSSNVIPFLKVRQRAEQVCSLIKPESLISTLEKVYEKTSPYDYEQLEFILDELQLLSSSVDQLNRSLESSVIEMERDKQILDCLKSYRRVSAASDEELLWGDIVTHRLPLHALTSREKHWQTISPELNADTVHLWIPMAATLRLPADSIYVTAVRNIVQSHVSQLPPEAQWSEHSVDSDFLDTVRGLLSHVTNMDLAVACVSWVARELPPGAEKVVVYSWCVSLQERHVASCSSQQRSQVMDVLEKHRSYSRQAAVEQVATSSMRCVLSLSVSVSYSP